MFFSFEADTCYEESSSAFQIRPAVQDFRDQESSRWKHVFFRLRMLDDAASSCTEQESKDACNVLQPCFCSAESWDEMSEPCGCRVKHEAMTGNVNRDGRPGFLLHLTNRNTTQHHSTSLDITRHHSSIFMAAYYQFKRGSIWWRSGNSACNQTAAHTLPMHWQQPLGSGDFMSDCFPCFSPSLSAQGQVTPRKNMGRQHK